MLNLDSSILNLILGLAATYLSLAVLVQVVQEVYKNLSDSKGRAYNNALNDFLGSWAKDLTLPGVLAGLRTRGPFQLTRLRPKGRFQPLDKSQLVTGLERTAPAWISRALVALNTEVELQGGSAGVVPAWPQAGIAQAEPSPSWKAFLDELSKAQRGSPGYWSAWSLAEFLNLWKHEWEKPSQDTEEGGNSQAPIGPLGAPTFFDAAQLLKAFRARFLPDVEKAAQGYPQFLDNFHYMYRRRNLRQTFVIAFLVAFLLDLSFQRIYDRAGKATPTETVALAENALKLYYAAAQTNSASGSLMNVSGGGSFNDPSTGMLTNVASSLTNQPVGDREKILQDAHSLLQQWITGHKQAVSGGNSTSLLDASTILAKFRHIPPVNDLIGYLITALLVSFGAPFWNDITSLLLNIQKAPKKAIPEPKAQK